MTIADRVLAGSHLTPGDIEPTICARALSRIGDRPVTRRQIKTIARDETRRFYDEVARSFLRQN